MKTCFWIEIIALVSALARAAALMIVTLGVVAGKASPKPELRPPRPPTGIQTQTYEGVITDTHCGAKHSAAIGKMAADCAIACVRGGEQFALVDGDTTYVLEGDPVTLKRGVGRRVRITGTPNGRKILVRSVTTVE